MQRKKDKITKYVLSSTLLATSLAGQASVYAADEKVAPDVTQTIVKELMNKGILTGNQNGDMNLDGKLTRIQVAAILARSLNLKLSDNPDISFKDVSSDSWGLKYIHALEKLGVITGSSGKFRPNDIITKEELAVILVRVTQTSIVGKGDNLTFSDKDSVSPWARAYVQAAIDAKLLPVDSGKFNPKKQVTRKEVAVVTDSFIKNEKFEAYKQSANDLLNKGEKISNSDPSI
ncbi:S-layer homology domain-containing protein [Paenibacillus xylanilyticus]|uniref:S-layer homology domain-containing protein n=1 Tax=Paenibacillus xylanilyticus TaxID=248903 RepID=A0A7Y6BU66_9BACL|nr:S-layer homology domain-containing protein [Paenibacillus xylanilyticus]NUU74826.1 S-layer homology domain-containing protein [Paenibacillus xylanilyticus]